MTANKSPKLNLCSSRANSLVVDQELLLCHKSNLPFSCPSISPLFAWASILSIFYLLKVYGAYWLHPFLEWLQNRTVTQELLFYSFLWSTICLGTSIFTFQEKEYRLYIYFFLERVSNTCSFLFLSLLFFSFFFFFQGGEHRVLIVFGADTCPLFYSL